jgi:hypothetical protein
MTRMQKAAPPSKPVRSTGIACFTFATVYSTIIGRFFRSASGVLPGYPQPKGFCIDRVFCSPRAVCRA